MQALFEHSAQDRQFTIADELVHGTNRSINQTLQESLVEILDLSIMEKSEGRKASATRCSSRPRRTKLVVVLVMCFTLLSCQCNAQRHRASPPPPAASLPPPAASPPPPAVSPPSSPGYGTEAHTIGINYGTLGNNLPTPAAAVTAIVSMKIGRVKIFNPNADILAALANSGLEAVVAIPNDQFGAIGTAASAAEAWITQNIAPYYPATNVVTILVGNEVLSDASLPWASLVPAMQNLQGSIAARGWNIKVSTAVAADVLASSYPPSSGTFRADIAVPVILPLLTFLSSSSSYFFVNLYPFLAYTTSAGDISLNYATFATDAAVVVDGALTYTNLFDAQLDAVIAAMEKLGFGGVRLAVGETGWPTKGDASQTGATVANAANYNRRLVRRILAASGGGTPKRPDVFIPTFIFALFNENVKPGAESERNWGLLYPNLTAVYSIDLTGQLLDNQYVPIAP